MTLSGSFQAWNKSGFQTPRIPHAVEFPLYIQLLSNFQPLSLQEQALTLCPGMAACGMNEHVMDQKRIHRCLSQTPWGKKKKKQRTVVLWAGKVFYGMEMALGKGSGVKSEASEPSGFVAEHSRWTNRNNVRCSHKKVFLWSGKYALNFHQGLFFLSEHPGL